MLTLLTARCLLILALLIYLSAYNAFVCLCCTTRTCNPTVERQSTRLIDLLLRSTATPRLTEDLPSQTLPCPHFVANKSATNLLVHQNR